MEMVLVFPFCVPAAAGIVCVFMGNPQNIFLNALFLGYGMVCLRHQERLQIERYGKFSESAE